jgi:hypothetical protein
VKKLGLLSALVGLAVASQGCAGLAYMNRDVAGAMGLYSETAVNERVTQNSVTEKKGQSCSTSILGLVTTGDASVATAAKAGGITKVTSVDNTFKNIVGVYAQYCVVVSGE